MTDAPATRIPDTLADDLRCAACPHILAAHDPLGIRFCSATIAGASSRGCICTGAALLPAPSAD
jgi:hypothetical protein